MQFWGFFLQIISSLFDTIFQQRNSKRVGRLVRRKLKNEFQHDCIVRAAYQLQKMTYKFDQNFKVISKCLFKWKPIELNIQSIIVFQMDIESCSWEWNQVFAPLQSSSLSPLQHQNILLQHHFSNYKDQRNHSHLLALSTDKLFLSELDSNMAAPFASTPLSFDLKFEVLHQTTNDLKSAKIGLKFYVEEQKGCQFYGESTVVNEWVKTLRQCLHQKGFHERFKPLKKLGKGNFATVYEVERFEDGKKFAVKAFSKQTCFSGNKGKQSLANELAVMRQLSRDPHKNVLQLEGVYQSDNSIYVVQDLIEGGGLFARIQERNGHFTASEVRECMLGLVAGLSKMHAKRIMHRDLKPENIMLRGPFSMDPIIVDFGLACNSDQDSYLFNRCGTPGYVAPEIIANSQNSHIEPQCDIFSAGAIFNLLLTRKPLFEGTQYNEVYKKNKEMNINLEGQLYHNVDPHAMDLLQKMLIADPKSRIKASQALKHPYFQAMADGEHKASASVTTASRK